MNDLILSPVPVDKLVEMVCEALLPRIIDEQKKAIGERLISPIEACKIFTPKISRVTLDAWTKANYLKRYDLGGRVWYRYSEVVEAAKSLKKYSHK